MRRQGIGLYSVVDSCSQWILVSNRIFAGSQRGGRHFDRQLRRRDRRPILPRFASVIAGCLDRNRSHNSNKIPSSLRSHASISSNVADPARARQKQRPPILQRSSLDLRIIRQPQRPNPPLPPTDFDRHRPPAQFRKVHPQSPLPTVRVPSLFAVAIAPLYGIVGSVQAPSVSNSATPPITSPVSIFTSTLNVLISAGTE